jgi:MFS family permease
VTTTVDRSLRADPDFRRYWLSRLVSVGGSMVTYVVLPVLVYQLTGSPLWSSLVAAAEALPYLFFGLFAGALADRLDRRRIMIGADVVSALVLLSVPVADLLGRLTAMHVLVVGFGVSTLFVFFDAANFGALPALAGRDRLAGAMSTVYGTSTVLELTVPVTAGAALAVVAPSSLLAVDALSFLGSALLIRAIVRPLNGDRAGAAGAGRLRREIGEGLRFVLRHPMVRVQTLLGFLACAGFGTFTGQLVPWADTALGVRAEGDARLGIIFAAWGVGGLLASLVYARLTRAIGEIPVTLLTIPLAAGIGVTAALSRHWLLAAALVTAWAVPSMLMILNAITLRAKVTPDRLQSRVNTAGRMIGFGLGTPTGALIGGAVASTASPRAAMLLSAGWLALAAVVAWLSPLRRYRHDPSMVAAATD